MVTVKYKNANYDAGNQSTLFTFEYEQDSTEYGVLVDSGPGLNLDNLLDTDEHLSATLLTHAHQDHIASLDVCLRDGAPIYASEETVTILKQSLAVDAGRVGINNEEEVINRLEVLDGCWTSLVRDVEVRPIPVGHAPGATGFLLRFDDDKHIFITGDFTQHDVAGNPGFDPTFNDTLQTETAIQTLDSQGSTDAGLSIGTLHLNAPTHETARDELQNALRMVYERTASGSNTIVTTSSLGGIHMAGLLDALQRDQETQFDIRLVGKVARVYEALDYDFSYVTTTPDFETGEDLLSPGVVTIAGPEDASTGSAARLLEAANQDAGNTAVVQLRSAGTDSIDAPWLTTYTFDYRLHPSEAELEEVIKTIKPIQVIMSHTNDKEKLVNWRESGRELGTFVWASYGHSQYELFDNGGFLSPDWIEGDWINTILQRNETREATSVPNEVLPTLDSGQLSLTDEGIDTEKLFAETDSLVDTNEGRFQKGEASVELDAGVYSLAQLAVEKETSRTRNEVSTTDMETLVMGAVDWFVKESLRDELPTQSTAPGIGESVSLSEHSSLAKMLEYKTPEGQTREEFLIDLLRDKLGLPPENSVTYRSSRLAPRMVYLEAIVENENNDFETVSEVVQAAIESLFLSPDR